MDKNKYIAPRMEITEFDENDIITTSPPQSTPDPKNELEDITV